MTDALDSYAVSRTHEGTEYRFRSVAAGEPSSVLLSASLSWVLFGPVTVVGLALPAAAMIEAMGWWLVNETVLMQRWIWLGVLIWIPLVLLVWGALQASGRTRLWITHNAVAWKVGMGRWRELPYSEIDDIWTVVGRVVIRDRRGRIKSFPIQDSPEVLALTGSLLAVTWRGARAGHAGQIPRGLRRLLAQRSLQR